MTKRMGGGIGHQFEREVSPDPLLETLDGPPKPMKNVQFWMRLPRAENK